MPYLTSHNFTEEQIKEAFWETFHRVGEVFFDYISTDEENEESTNETWLEFLDNLEKQ